MKNLPQLKLGIVAVSRDCFPMELSESRRKAVVENFKKSNVDIFECLTTVENETHMLKALKEVKEAGVNALVVYLGNFGPETSETLLAKQFGGPVMFVAASEESGDNLMNGRGDAYCGMLNASYNLALRNIKAFIPEYPVGTASEVADMISEFVPVATTLLGLDNLKIISFGPRPQDFLACNAPIKQLYNLGVEIEENSELDLYAAFNAHASDSRIPGVISSMEKELGKGNKMPGILPKLAQYEITLLDWMEEHKGSRKFVVFANKCWPSFQTQFGFVPCYVNSRLTAMGIPVSCEVDIYGALSEYIGTCISQDVVTLLDINNTVPNDMYESEIKGKFDYTLKDTFMGFHCGNTAACKLTSGTMKFQKIMARSLEPNVEPNITRGTLEGDIIPGEITFFRLQSNAESELTAYVAEGEVLPVSTRSFGSIGVFAIPEMARFYRNVLIEKRYPHHGAVAFGHYGKAMYNLFRYLGVKELSFNQPKGMLYNGENPFK
ncbi:L-fucose/L-arabinose isomerase family protein [Clostridium estertheticum]|uniref:L-fucose/L-arabinose isomerase family protein n=1 Tax=Clostridium estertheticum TaxID=238834 RepID=UPI001CF31725|nr:L-fucose/L-arabinose isomerase family protein [Clostridium estertheticum]MCB2358839.1 L-fucose/L-arabinose isomerase family protein [Clostridium estertheticum]